MFARIKAWFNNLKTRIRNFFFGARTPKQPAWSREQQNDTLSMTLPTVQDSHKHLPPITEKFLHLKKDDRDFLYYVIVCGFFGVNWKIAAQDINKAFHKAALIFHPDKAPHCLMPITAPLVKEEWDELFAWNNRLYQHAMDFISLQHINENNPYKPGTEITVDLINEALNDGSTLRQFALQRTETFSGIVARGNQYICQIEIERQGREAAEQGREVERQGREVERQGREVERQGRQAAEQGRQAAEQRVQELEQVLENNEEEQNHVSPTYNGPTVFGR
jgi:hypothetical protein